MQSWGCKSALNFESYLYQIFINCCNFLAPAFLLLNVFAQAFLLLCKRTSVVAEKQEFLLPHQRPQVPSDLGFGRKCPNRALAMGQKARRAGVPSTALRLRPGSCLSYLDYINCHAHPLHSWCYLIRPNSWANAHVCALR